jgi:hypothetical protein
MYMDAHAKLDGLNNRVSQGLDLQPALDFAAFVLWSGLVPLCRIFADPKPPKIDPDLLKWKAEELQRDVRSHWTKPSDKRIKLDLLTSIHHKLDTIAGVISGMQPQSPTPPK